MNILNERLNFESNDDDKNNLKHCETESFRSLEDDQEQRKGIALHLLH